MLLMGFGIGAIWTIDIVRSPEIDRSRGLFRARERSTGSILLPHWLAEYSTAALLLAGGCGLVLGTVPGALSWTVPVALGALAYTSLNSLGWVLDDRSRAAYGVPMAIGLVGAIMAIGLLLSGSLLAPSSG